MQAIKMLFIMLIFVLVVGFITQNQWMLNQDQFVIFSFYGYRTLPLPIPLIMALCILMGATFISFSMFLTQLRLKRKSKELKKTIRLMEQEINELRNLPITEIEENIGEVDTSDEDSE